MLCKTSVKAYAKVNFGLKVLPKTESKTYTGAFHNLFGIFQTIDLFDELVVCWDPDSKSYNSCNVSCSDVKLPEKNTVTSAYHAFIEVLSEIRKEDAKIPSISVELQKGIPSGGGLGGGSSDAAALVRVLEKICGVSLSFEQLDRIASKVGSDVFFFVHCDSEGKGCAFVSGRGEIIRKMKPRNDLFLLLIFPSVGSSTKEAYELIDKAYLEDENFAKENKVISSEFFDWEVMYNDSVQNWAFKNTFTPIIANKYCEIRNSIDDLKKTGCCFAEMSGSGSTVFGVFTLRQQADSVSNLLAEKWNCKLVRTV